MPPSRQVKSKQRVADYGEVFTAPREVNAMLDLVQPAFERVESTFLDPACGDGNFLVEILRRKFELIERDAKSPKDYERSALIALGSIYGVEIQDDNARECRERLLSQWLEAYNARMGKKGSASAREQAREIVELNIVRGNFLTSETVDKRGRDTGEPIYMYSWTYGEDKMSKKRERLQEPPQQAPSLFDAQGDASESYGGAQELESKRSAPVAQDVAPPPSAPVKKPRRSSSTGVKKRAKTVEQEESPSQAPTVNIAPTEQDAEIVALPPPAPSRANAPTAHSELFPIQTSEQSADAPNPIETFFTVFERVSRVVDARVKDYQTRSDVKYVQKMLRAMNEKLAKFYAAQQSKQSVSTKVLLARKTEVVEMCVSCSGAVKGLVALTTEEQNEIVSAFDSVRVVVESIVEKEYDNDANE